VLKQSPFTAFQRSGEQELISELPQIHESCQCTYWCD